jgi:hypothetical protein
MINNRPSLSLLPKTNKRILGQSVAMKGMIYGSILSFFSIILFKYFQDTQSLNLIKTRKQFSF